MCKLLNVCITKKKMHCLHKSGSILVGDACGRDLMLQQQQQQQQQQVQSSKTSKTLDLKGLVGAQTIYFC